MSLLWNIIVLIVIGAIAGFIARAVIPGKQHMSVGMTIVLGIVGSVVGNLLGSLLFEPHRFELGTSGIIGSIIGAIIVLGIYVAVQGRGHRSVTR
ncbi:GlsB/YeaQ/YmgE family stress response membrane protein [Geodermatophilus sp. URMC 63]